MDSMLRTFDVVVTEDEDGLFVATVPALRGCVTQGGSREEALENVKEAILLCLGSGDEPDSFVRSVSVETVSVEA